DPKIFQVLANLVRQSPCRNRGNDKCYQRETQWMSENGAIAAFASRKGAKKRQDPFAKIDRQCQDRAQLNDDRIHLPEAVLKIDMQQCFADAQMRGRAYREKFSQPLHDSEKDRQEVFIHATRCLGVKALKRKSGS